MLTVGEQRCAVLVFGATCLLSLFFAALFGLAWFSAPPNDEYTAIKGIFSLVFLCGMLFSARYLQYHVHRLMRPDR